MLIGSGSISSTRPSTEASAPIRTIHVMTDFIASIGLCYALAATCHPTDRLNHYRDTARHLFGPHGPSASHCSNARFDPFSVDTYDQFPYGIATLLTFDAE